MGTSQQGTEKTNPGDVAAILHRHNPVVSTRPWRRKVAAQAFQRPDRNRLHAGEKFVGLLEQEDAGRGNFSFSE
jgi:hypothetical protein